MPGIDLLQPQKHELSQARNFEIPDGKAVKLMSVNGQMPLARIVPRVLLVNRNADQMRHHFREAVIMIAFHPDHFHIVFGVGQLANESEKFPVFLGQPAEVQIGKHIAQQNQPPKVHGLQEFKGIACPADVGTKVQVGDDYRVKVLLQHALLL